MIQLTNLSCGYGQKLVLEDVNLQIEAGKMTCLLGKNGTGKTTLFKTLLGMLPPLKGDIYLEGKPLKSYSPKSLSRLMSYVPQAHGTPFPFTVFEVVLMGQYSATESFWHVPGKKNKIIALKALQQLQIERLRHRQFASLSGGEQQLVLIARALAQQPQYITMDEPTSNLDLGNQLTVMKMASCLRDEGYGVIINTHNPEQALNYADQVVLLRNGKVRKAGNPIQVLNSQMISEIYSTDIELVEARTKDGLVRRVCVAL
ncbi:ABC transporter ATP-binding protein [Mangrovibacterium diazotrophicum]|uniref:Iron complex transport system ATP-binding protein n=1 Tax=Mangrovibacterium diazotrophicum TaxID=1261403 RepID=A0A419W4M3_9BACT|nr:ABC transporter ATP-binding protein [Mangrovibacterium diazotrophicum]RKD90399.1 iron complex transport system ATP-binding protein [Mangrovibacterium diazotrophicum]